MRFLLKVALAVALIAHALLGCCAHHAHAGHEAVAAHEHGDHDDEGQGEEPCHENKCVFASGAVRVVVDSPLVAEFAAAEFITVEATSGVRMAAADLLERPGGLDLCILHQRLVI